MTTLDRAKLIAMEEADKHRRPFVVCEDSLGCWIVRDSETPLPPGHRILTVFKPKEAALASLDC